MKSPNRYRVAMGQMPQLLREILRTSLESQRDMELIDEVELEGCLADAIESRDIDVLVLGCPESAFPEIGEPLLRKFPRLKVLSITNQGRSTWLYELAPRRVAFGEVSPQRLAELIRSSCGTTTGAS